MNLDIEDMVILAEHLKKMHDANIKAGFTKEESMEIVKTSITAASGMKK